LKDTLIFVLETVSYMLVPARSFLSRAVLPIRFSNPGKSNARMLIGCVPPGHEKYFDELAALLAKEGPPDPQAVATLRMKYDTIQLSGMRSE
jgi:hypothetical protein